MMQQLTSPQFIRLDHLDRGNLSLTRRVKDLARSHGLAVASVTSADPFMGLDEILSDHIGRGRVEGMDWFTQERAQFSTRPANLLPLARSILAVGVPYWSVDEGKPDDGVDRGRIARYAWGCDYHDVLKRRMKALLAAIEAEAERPVEARLLVDTARIVDRAVAARSGLGWYGKHSCIIVPGHGSWVMLGEMLLDLDLVPDQPLGRDCGRCTICLDRCPTGAIVGPYQIDAPKCLSFQTIEQRGSIPRDLRPLLGDWIFGCDVCQEVCPYTRAAQPVLDPEFAAQTIERRYPSLQWLLAMTEAEFREMYRGSAVRRAKRRGIARNAAVALGNTGNRDAAPVLVDALTSHDESLVRGHAAWALGRLGGRVARAALESARNLEPDATVYAEITNALEQ